MYLLVGRPDYARNLGPQVNLTAATAATMQNWFDPSNVWVVLNPQTGVVTTAPVAAVDPSVINTPGSGWRGNCILSSCGLAQQGQALGGK